MSKVFIGSIAGASNVRGGGNAENGKNGKGASEREERIGLGLVGFRRGWFLWKVEIEREDAHCRGAYEESGSLSISIPVSVPMGDSHAIYGGPKPSVDESAIPIWERVLWDTPRVVRVSGSGYDSQAEAAEANAITGTDAGAKNGDGDAGGGGSMPLSPSPHFCNYRRSCSWVLKSTNANPGQDQDQDSSYQNESIVDEDADESFTGSFGSPEVMRLF